MTKKKNRKWHKKTMNSFLWLALIKCWMLLKFKLSWDSETTIQLNQIQANHSSHIYFTSQVHHLWYRAHHLTIHWLITCPKVCWFEFCMARSPFRNMLATHFRPGPVCLCFQLFDIFIIIIIILTNYYFMRGVFAFILNEI